MVQTGDPTNTGKGGESIWGGKFQDEIKDDLKHKTRGVLSMANSGPNTNGSQWFLTYAPQPSLDLKYTVFGKVIDGWDTLDELERIPVNPKNHRPLKGWRPPSMQSPSMQIPWLVDLSKTFILFQNIPFP